MTWHVGTYKCGHTGRVNLTGNMEIRLVKAEDEFSKLCRDCYLAQLNERTKEENKSALKEAEELKLPVLQGTPKQVEWAISIRKKLIDKMNMIEERHTQPFEELDDYTFEEVLQIKSYIMYSKIEAKFFIDERDTSILKLFKKIRTEALANN